MSSRLPLTFAIVAGENTLIHHSFAACSTCRFAIPTDRLAEAGVEPSVSSVGDSCGNALAETINGLYRAEVTHRRGPWRNLQAVEMVTLEWVDWFNHRRLLEPVGNVPPAEVKAAHYQQLPYLLRLVGKFQL
jgi:putative transposase